MADLGRAAYSLAQSVQLSLTPPPTNAIKNRYSTASSVVTHGSQNGADTAAYTQNSSVSSLYSEPNVISISGPATGFRPVLTYVVSKADLATLGIVADDNAPPLVSMSIAYVKATLKNMTYANIYFGLCYGADPLKSNPLNTTNNILFNNNATTPVAGYLGAGDATTFAHTARYVDDGTTHTKIHEGIPLKANYSGKDFRGIIITLIGVPTVTDGVTQSYFESCRAAVVSGSTLDNTKTYLNHPADDVKPVHYADLDPQLQGMINAPSNTLNVASADKITVIGDSFSAAYYVVPGKAYIHTLSMLSDYNFENFSASGYNAEQLKNAVRNNKAWYHGTLGFKDYKTKYAVIITNENDIWYYNQNPDMYIDNLRGLIEVVKSTGATPILSTEFGSGASTSGELRHLKALKQLADKYNIILMDVVTKSRLWNQQTYAPFWGNGHPGTRTTHHFADGMKKYLDSLPRPRQSLKIFRQRSTFTASTINDLLFDNNLDRAVKFKELVCGHYGLTPTTKYYYDALDVQNTAQQYISEYLQLQNGENITFPNYGLVDAILPCTARTLKSLSLTISDPTVAVYVRHEATTPYESDVKYQQFNTTGSPSIVVGDTYTSNDAALAGYTFTVFQSQANGVVQMSTSGILKQNLGAGTLTRQTGTGATTISYTASSVGFDQNYYDQLYKPIGKWVQLTGSSGTYTVNTTDFPNVMNYDKVSFLLYKSGGFTLNNVYVSWSGTEDKSYPSPVVLKESANAELLTKPYVDSTSLTGWTTTGTVTAISAPDGIYPYGVTQIVELDNTNSISQSVTFTSNPEIVQEVQVKIWCRRFPTVFPSNGTWANAPITEDTFDLASLVVDVTDSADTTWKNVARHKHTVGLHWKEVIFNVPVPTFVNGTAFKLYSNDANKIQIARVSAKLM